MKTLIIGGAGFVAAYLIRHLYETGERNLVVTKLSEETIDASLDSYGVTVRNLDILKYDEITELLNRERPDFIYHLAAQSSVAVSWKRPQLTVDINVKGTINLLEAIRTLDYKPRVLLVGSSEEYGHVQNDEAIVNEQNPIRPRNIYAATKACQNMIGKIYADAYDLPIIMVRAFNHIGPKQSPTFVVSDFCKQVVEIESGKREPIIRVGNLSAKRDFTDVRDVVRAYELLMKYGKAGETYNVGSGHAIAIREILDAILQLADVSIRVVVDDDKLRPVDVPLVEANIQKLYKCTNWTPSYKLMDTISDVLQYWRSIQ